MKINWVLMPEMPEGVVAVERPMPQVITVSVDIPDGFVPDSRYGVDGISAYKTAVSEVCNKLYHTLTHFE